jgi:Zn-dependent protease
MLTLLFLNPLAFAVLFPGLLASITIHEFAHAWAADKLGDPTPRYQGRLTLDPRAHLDPWGVVAILLTRFGWGRPVEFDPYNLKEPWRDTALIALAGPVSNLIVAVGLSLLIKLGLLPTLWLIEAAKAIFYVNVMLALFNLIPVHPLDGSKIVTAFLPKITALEYEEFMARYGLLILLLIIMPWNGQSVANIILEPIFTVISNLLL